MKSPLAHAIPGRELIALPGHGVIIRGTFHTGLEPRAEGRVGVVFLNSLSLPRTATGDSAVYWAECFASAGYPSFRLDLPGLGDSGGATPAELLNYINAGEYATIVSTKIKELAGHFALSGVVLVGHCAGTVTALHAAAASSKTCLGLVLLDPYFHLPQAVRPVARRRLSEWALNSRMGGLLSNGYDYARKILLTLHPNVLPLNANKELIVCWKNVASSGLPILLFKAPARKAVGTKPRAGEFDYLSHILAIAGPDSQIQVKLVEQTDHSFANQAGRTAVARDVQRWLMQRFPIRLNKDATTLFSGVEAPTLDNTNSLHLNYLHG